MANDRRASKRASAGAWVLAAAAVAGALHALHTGIGTLQQVRAGGNAIEQYQARFEPVLPFLPPRGEVGYMADVPLRGSVGALARFYVAQYTLSPRVLRHDETDVPYVVADYLSRLDAARLAEPLGLSVLADPGNGIAVLGRPSTAMPPTPPSGEPR